MHDDPTGDALLARLGAQAREAPLDPRLEALALGTLSPDEHAALLREAAADPELAAAVEAFTPLDEAAQGRMADHLISQVISKTSAPPRDEPGRVLPFRRPLGRVVLAVVPLAVAAALAFFLLRPEAPKDAALPGYALRVEGGEKALRSDGPEDGPPRLLPATRLRLVLTPAEAIPTPLAVRAWRVRAGVTEPWAVAPRWAPNGAALIEGTAQALGLADLPPGRVTLVVAIGPEAALPSEAPEPAAAAAAFRVLSTEIEVLAP